MCIINYFLFLYVLDSSCFCSRYYANQQLTEKSDVYSFGVVLLELISGKKPVSTEDFGAEMNIVHWVCMLPIFILYFVGWSTWSSTCPTILRHQPELLSCRQGPWFVKGMLQALWIMSWYRMQKLNQSGGLLKLPSNVCNKERFQDQGCKKWSWQYKKLAR